MSKDAKGHGSEGRGGNHNTADVHQHLIARDTVMNPAKGMFLGGPTAQQAETTLRGKFGYTDKDIAGLKGDGGNKAAAATLAGGHPKSAPVAAHPAMASFTPSASHPGFSERGGVVKDAWGRTDADLKKDYGGPVRHFDGK